MREGWKGGGNEGGRVAVEGREGCSGSGRQRNRAEGRNMPIYEQMLMKQDGGHARGGPGSPSGAKTVQQNALVRAQTHAQAIQGTNFSSNTTPQEVSHRRRAQQF